MWKSLSRATALADASAYESDCLILQTPAFAIASSPGPPQSKRPASEVLPCDRDLPAIEIAQSGTEPS
jgi:hypothetical protein